MRESDVIRMIKQKESDLIMKPTMKEAEEYMASLNLLGERQFNGTTAKDIYDTVNKPKHYMLFAAEELHKKDGIEVRDVIEKLVSKFGNKGFDYNYPADSTLFESDYVQMMQYLMRFMDKNGREDLQKAQFYLDKLIQSY